MFACLNAFDAHPVVYRPSPTRKKKGINHFALLQLSFQFVCHKCQGTQWCGYTQRGVPEEKRKQERGSWDHCLEIRYQHRAQPCQHRVTLGSRHAVGDFSSSASTCSASAPYNSFHCCPASWSSSQRLSLIACDVNVFGLKLEPEEIWQAHFLFLQTHWIRANLRQN